MINDKTNGSFEQPRGVVKKLKQKTNRVLYSFLSVLLMVVVLFIASVIPLSELPTLISVDPQSMVLATPGSGIGNFISIGDSIGDFFENSIIMKIIPATIVILGMACSVIRGNFMMGAFAVMFALMFSSMPTLLNVMTDGDFSHSEKSEGVNLETYIKSGDTKGYLEALSQSSPRGEFVINSVLESNVANQDDASNLIDVFSKEDAQRVSVGLSEAMAVEGHLTGGIPAGLPVSAALAAYVIEAAGGITAHKVIDERTGYAIFAEAKKLPGFDKPNPYADEINAQIESSKSRHQLMSNAMAVLTGIAIVLLFILVASYRNVQRVKNVIREEENMRDSLRVR